MAARVYASSQAPRPFCWLPVGLPWRLLLQLQGLPSLAVMLKVM